MKVSGSTPETPEHLPCRTSTLSLYSKVIISLACPVGESNRPHIPYVTKTYRQFAVKDFQESSSWTRVQYPLSCGSAALSKDPTGRLAPMHPTNNASTWMYETQSLQLQPHPAILRGLAFDGPLFVTRMRDRGSKDDRRITPIRNLVVGSRKVTSVIEGFILMILQDWVYWRT